MIKEMRDNGASISKISRDLGISRPTVRKYLNSDNLPSFKKHKKPSILDPYKPYIKERIEKYDVSAIRIFEEIKEKGYPGKYTIVKDYCREIRKKRSIQAVYRFETDPGEQAQVDFGYFGYIDEDGKTKRLYAFSMILGYSRKRYVEFTTNISTSNIIKMHINAFHYFGGYTDTILYDNMKQIVIERKINASESTFNKDFLDFAEYYGIVIRLSWPYRPQTKGKIENTIKYVRNNFFKGRAFTSISDINNQCMEWLNTVNSKIHSTTGEIPNERAKSERLNPITNVPEYALSVNETRKVTRDCYVSYKGNRYSVPWKYAGREAKVTEMDSKLKISIDDEEIVHELVSGTGRIIRKKEHFSGLLKGIRDENREKYEQLVEKRDLKIYDEVGENEHL
jgi:transposase